MELIQHIIGICPDAHSHLDVSDIFINFPVIHEFVVTAKLSIVNFFKRIFKLN